MNVTHEDLMGYLTNFEGKQRETVYKAILKSDMLDQALTNEGRLIVNNIAEMIASDVVSIVTACAGKNPGPTLTKEIYPKALEINLAYKLMVSWAKILIDGDKHKQKIGEKK
jgi:hypothetical protein